MQKLLLHVKTFVKVFKNFYSFPFTSSATCYFVFVYFRGLQHVQPEELVYLQDNQVKLN